MSRGGAILASLLVTIGRPAWWFLALAAFLVRGGFALFVLPIVLLPSPLAISNSLGPLIIPIALGRISTDVIAVAVVGSVAFLAWLVVGGWIAAAIELTLIREATAAAREEGIGPDLGVVPPAATPDSRHGARRDRILISRMVVARLVAWLPLGIAISVAAIRIVAIAYVELTRPDSVSSPLVLRIASGAVPELVVVAIAWTLGELVGGQASRRIAHDGKSTGRALRLATRDLVRHPASTVVPWVLTTGVLAAILGGAIAAASVAWSRVIVALSARDANPLGIALNLFLFVAIWLAALDLAGLCAAVRGTSVTFEDLRWRSATGTFGASAHHRPGDWSVRDEGGSL